MITLSDKNRIHHFNQEIFYNIDSAEKAYWIGFILADGYVHEKKGFLRIKLQKNERYHLERFINFIGGDLDMIKYDSHTLEGYDKLYEAYYAEVNSKKLVNSLIKLKIRQAKSTREQVVKVPDNLVRDFIRGLWDGDGFIRGENKRIGIGLINSLEVVSYVQNIFKEELGCKKLKIYDHYTTCKIEYRSKKSINSILSYLYYDECLSLDRKYSLAQRFATLLRN